jgi:hypothetical protein
VTSDFQWWLLIVGLAIGAGLAWLVLEDRRRAEDELFDRQIDAESTWIADRLRQRGGPPRTDLIVRVLELHRDYLAREPEPDDDWSGWDAEAVAAETGASETGAGATGTDGRDRAAADRSPGGGEPDGSIANAGHDRPAP